MKYKYHGPSTAVPTVRIVDPQDPDGFLVINESDFDETVHKRYRPKPEASSQSPSDVRQAGRRQSSAGASEGRSGA